MRHSGRSEEGTTLVELLVAISILGIAFTAIVGGLFTSAVTSDAIRKQAAAAASLASYAEAVKADPYLACATTYPGTGFTLPAGFTKGAVAVAYWNATSLTFDATCTTDPGLQRVTLSLTSTDGRAPTSIQLAKRLA